LHWNLSQYEISTAGLSLVWSSIFRDEVRVVDGVDIRIILVKMLKETERVNLTYVIQNLREHLLKGKNTSII
jgi:hypothetical protein